MKLQHGLDDLTISGYEIQSTSKPCPDCGYHQSNLTVHKKYCKKQKVVEEVEHQEEIERDPEVPDGLNPGGAVLFPRFKHFLGTQALSTSVQHKYFKKMVAVCSYWEKSIRGFRTDGLMWPLEKGILFPDLAGYTARSETAGDKTNAIKSYLYFCKFMKQVCSSRYTADKNFTMVDRKAFTDTTRDFQADQSGQLKGLNRASAMKSAEHAMDKEESKTHLGYNPERLKEAVIYILEHKLVEVMLKDLTTLTKDEIQRKYEEIEVRNFLLAMLMITADGQRQHAIANMLIENYDKAVNTKDDVMVVKVKDHKTAKSHGFCPIPFIIDGLFEATRMYLITFR